MLNNDAENLDYKQLAQVLGYLIPAMYKKFHFLNSFLERIRQINLEEAERLDIANKPLQKNVY